MTDPRVDDPKRTKVATTPQNTSQAKLVRMGVATNTGAAGKKRPVG